MIQTLTEALATALSDSVRVLITDPGAYPNVVIERPKHAEHGDLSSPIALNLARVLKTAPKIIAGQLVEHLRLPAGFTEVAIAANGFLNFTIDSCQLSQEVATVLHLGNDYGRGSDTPAPILLEYVSANPTGPLHVGHGRGAAIGDSLANILSFAGYPVHREYYVNDAGRQIDILALSVWLRYVQHAGLAVVLPAKCYQGAYVGEIAERYYDVWQRSYLPELAALTQCAEHMASLDEEQQLDGWVECAVTWLGASAWQEIRQAALDSQLNGCRQTLEHFGVVFDRWFSERSLHESIQEVIAQLKQSDLVYEQDRALWFKAEQYGDEKDRVLQRANGAYTYFAADIAYHHHKLSRASDGRLVNIWGADHHGYVSRVKGALMALGHTPARLDILLVQFASLLRHGEKVAMSTRAGEYVTLDALIAEIGQDAARFFYCLRRSDQHLEFDLALAAQAKQDNPVFYVQYAHARICSVIHESGVIPTAHSDLTAIDLTEAHHILLNIGRFGQVIKQAAAEYAPHLLAFYLRELSASFHNYYNKKRIIDAQNPEATGARVALIAAVAQIIRTGLKLLGVSAPMKM